MLFVFKQKTAYGMCISDWSSDVCSSDLHDYRAHQRSAPGSERAVHDIGCNGVACGHSTKRKRPQIGEVDEQIEHGHHDQAEEHGMTHAPPPVAKLCREIDRHVPYAAAAEDEQHHHSEQIGQAHV